MAAAGGELQFERALESVISAFSGVGGVVFELNRKTGAISNWCGRGLEAGQDDYIQHINAINPRMQYSLRHAPGHIVYEGKFIDERSMDQHEFYDWLARVEGMRYFLGARVYDEGDVTLFHSVEFLQRQGHPEAAEIEAFRRLAPAIGNAWRIAKRSALDDGGLPGANWTPDHLPWSILAVDFNGRVVQTNSAGRAMLEAGTVLYVHNDVLRPRERSRELHFSQAMAKALNGLGSEVLLTSEPPAPPLVAQFVPVNPGQLSHPTLVSALIYIWNPLESSAGLGAALMRLFGLTVAESQLAEQLATGAELNIAAERLGISRNTARNHLQQIFAKTGTRRQGELLVQILGVLRD
ncbi:MAG: helix-turn-helix transcriptional regulator [Pseudomonadota bacterium]